MIIQCHKCNHQMHILKKDTEGYYNWKCTECSTIIPLKNAPGVIWKCSTGTPKRKK